jgi:hypothetical protein
MSLDDIGRAADEERATGLGTKAAGMSRRWFEFREFIIGSAISLGGIAVFALVIALVEVFYSYGASRFLAGFIVGGVLGWLIGHGRKA